MKNENRLPGINNPDLPDSFKDKKELQPDEATLNLPDVKDIPGQEHIHVPPLGELADTTVSSDDEEGKGIFDEEENEESDSGTENDITDEERESLDDTDEYVPDEDDNNLKKAALDDTDADGDLLNEESFDKDHSADDLDVPGSELDDQQEEIGGEDEENNDYSLNDD